MFTGNADIDYEIMIGLNDRDLLNFCQTNKYISGLCTNDNFWKRRFQKRFNTKYNSNGDLKTLPIGMTWRNFYLRRLVSGSSTYTDMGITVDVTIMKDSQIFKDTFKRTKNFIRAEKRKFFEKLLDDPAFDDILEQVIIEELTDLIGRDGINGTRDILQNDHYMLYNNNIEQKLIKHEINIEIKQR